VIKEMKDRGYKPNPTWNDYYYRGKRCKTLDPKWIVRTRRVSMFPEHNRKYLILCVRKLTKKLKGSPAGKYDENEVYRFYSWVQEKGIQID